MMLTTKGRYAVMAMADIAAFSKGAPVRLSEIAERQDITVAYLEQIFALLKKKSLVISVRGPGGGYMLGKGSEDIVVAEIIQAVNEPIKMTRCNHEPDNGCVSNARCLTHDLWEGLGNQIYAYLRSVTLKEVAGSQCKGERFATKVQNAQLLGAVN